MNKCNSCDRSDIIHVVLVKPFQTYNYRVDELRVLMHDTVVELLIAIVSIPMKERKYLNYII